MSSKTKILASLLMTSIATSHSWSRAWMRGPAINCASKKAFRGANRLVLTLTAAQNGWSGNRWGTESQWIKRGFAVPRGTSPTVILSMVEAQPSDTVCLRYGVKRITMVRPHDEYAAIQVGDDDTWTPIKPSLSGIVGLVAGAFGGHVSMSAPDLAMMKGSDAATPEECHASHLVRAALRMTIETQMLFLLPETMTDPDILSLAAEIGVAFVLNDFGMIPERLRDQATVRRWSLLMLGKPEIAMFAAGLAQHAIDRMSSAATVTEAKAA